MEQEVFWNQICMFTHENGVLNVCFSIIPWSAEIMSLKNHVKGYRNTICQRGKQKILEGFRETGRISQKFSLSLYYQI